MIRTERCWAVYRETDDALAAAKDSRFLIQVLSETGSQLLADSWQKMAEARDGTLRRLHIVASPNPEYYAAGQALAAAEAALELADPDGQFDRAVRDNLRHGKVQFLRAWVSPRCVAHMVGERLHIARNPEDHFDDIYWEPTLTHPDGWVKHRLLLGGEPA